jgi:hypothetical protein
MGGDDPQAQAMTERAGDASEHQSVRRRKPKDTDHLRQMFSQHGYETLSVY